MGCLLSVVIAAYNAQRVLDTCLESFARLPLDSYEVIVVDDGSTDETFAVAQQFAARHAFARVVHRENGGVSSARNSGMAAAEGNYLFFADADDWVEPDQLAALVKAAAETTRISRMAIIIAKAKAPRAGASCFRTTFAAPIKKRLRLYNALPYMCRLRVFRAAISIALWWAADRVGAM